MSLLRDTQLAWLAGLLEGEGAFCLRKRKGTRYGALIEINMTDRDIIERVAKMWGVSVYVIKLRADRPNMKPAYRATITGRKAVDWMKAVFPFMGLRRKERILSCVEAWETRPKRQPVDPEVLRIAALRRWRKVRENRAKELRM